MSLLMLGFKRAVIPLTAIDGSFMKTTTTFSNQVSIIAAVSTGNNCNTILAFAIARTETEETWSPFLKPPAKNCLTGHYSLV
jgi:hypothetical protein